MMDFMTMKMIFQMILQLVLILMVMDTLMTGTLEKIKMTVLQT